MTQRDTMQSFHEPFSDSFYYGSEFASERFEDDPEHREDSGASGVTFRDVLNGFEDAQKEVR